MQALGALREDETLVCMLLPLQANTHAPLGLCARLRAVSHTFNRAVAVLRPHVHLALRGHCAKEGSVFAAARQVSSWARIVGLRTSPVSHASARACPALLACPRACACGSRAPC